MNKNFKYYDLIAAFFVAVLIISNIASAKIVKIGIFSFDGGTILFPISYIFGDILTEVYGYAKTRRIIWTGFFSLIIMSIVFYIIQLLPADPDWTNQIAYEAILGFVPRIVIASIIAYWLGEFTNSFILAKMKSVTRGRWLWTRTIGSTAVGQAIDSVIFSIIAFSGLMPFMTVINIIVSIYLMKVIFEVIATPVTYLIVNALKKREGIDHLDNDTNFSPFSLEI